jgi:hypothetical protein
LFHSQVINPKNRANACQETALEAKKSERRLINLGLVDKFQFPAIFLETIDVDEATSRRWRADYHVLGSSDNKECFVILARELNCGNAHGSLIVFKIKGVDDRLGSGRVYHLDARSPMSSTAGVSKLGGWEFSILAIAALGILNESLACRRRQNIVIRFNDIEQGLLGMLHETARCVRERD